MALTDEQILTRIGKFYTIGYLSKDITNYSKMVVRKNFIRIEDSDMVLPYGNMTEEWSKEFLEMDLKQLEVWLVAQGIQPEPKRIKRPKNFVLYD